MDSDYSVIYAAAMRMLAAREHSVAELTAKLAKKSEQQTLIDRVIQEFIDHGYLNDDRFTEIFIRQKAQSGKGPFLIRQLLKAKGISQPNITIAFEASDCNWFDVAQQAYQKKFHTPVQDLKDKAKRQRFLMSRGFSADVITEVIESCQLY